MKFIPTLKRVAAFGLLAGTAALAHAGPAAAANWTLTNASFDDGTTVSGQFSYDAAADNLLSYSFTVANGSLPATTYDGSDSYLYASIATGYWTPNELAIAAQDGSYIVFNFASALSNAGGTVSLLTNSADLTTASWESNSDGSVTRYLTQGAVTTQAAAVPEPATLTLALGGLGALGLVVARRRKP